MTGAMRRGWDDPVTGTQIGVFGRFADELGGAFAAAQPPGGGCTATPSRR